jgi:hypothetical protein
MIVEIIFFISLLGIIGMIVLKSGELKGGKKSIISRMGSGVDHIVQGTYNKIRFVISQINANNVVHFIQWIAYHVLSVLHKVYMYIHDKAHRHPHSKKVIDMVKGKVEVKNNGGSSFFLKKIAEETKK